MELTSKSLRLFILYLIPQVFYANCLHPRVPQVVYRNTIEMSSSTSDERIAPKVLGVCGGIGSGKSTACKILESDLSCLAHLDADKVAHKVYSPGSQAIRDIVKEFGTGILQDDSDEEIDRKKLGAIVFSDRAEMSKLEHIVWPHVKTELKNDIDKVKADWLAGKATGTNPVIVVEAAVLLDAGWDDVVDGVWVVTTPTSIALTRLMETRGLSEEEAQKRISAQESRRGMGNLDEELKNKLVTTVIENKGTLDDLKQKLLDALDNPASWK